MLQRETQKRIAGRALSASSAVGERGRSGSRQEKYDWRNSRRRIC